MRLVLSVLATLVVCLSPAGLWAQEFEYHGFLDTYHAARMHDPYDFLSSRTRLRFESWLTAGDAAAFVSINAEANNVISDESGLELREAFLDYQSERWDIRIGRQIIVWGKADGVVITDVVSPWDYTEFLARDFDDIRLAVDAVRWRLLFNQCNFELLVLPRFRAAVLAPQGTPWAFDLVTAEDASEEFAETIEPDSTFGNIEVGGRLSFYFPWGDLAFSAFYTWDDLPTLHREVFRGENGTTIRYLPEHHRLTIFGAEFAIPHGEFVFRGETAFCSGERFEPADNLSEEIFERYLLKWMFGVDWSPGHDWMVTAQLVDDFILAYDEAIGIEEHRLIVTLHISKKLYRQTLTLATMNYFEPSGSAIFNRTYADYALTDEVHLFLGVDVFIGDAGLMGQFDDNDEVWIKAKYSF